MLRKPNGAIEKPALDWNPQGVKRQMMPQKHLEEDFRSGSQ
jgi:hypothetical protein